jgi:AraC-like DNA-binding protein
VADRRRAASNGHWLLVLVDDGHVRITWQGLHCELQSGMATILPAGAGFREQTLVPSRTAYFPLVLTGVSEFKPNPLASLPLPVAMPLIDQDGAAALLDEVAQMSPRYTQRPHYVRLRANMICMELFYNAIAGGFASKKLPSSRNTMPEWLQQGKELLIKNYANPDLNIGTIATEIARSESHFKRALKKAFDYPPKEWPHRYRIDMAVNILTHTPNMSVSSIISRCGYRNRALFYRMFKRYRGCLPSDLRHGKSRQ